jgi:hypothetical protein
MDCGDFLVGVAGGADDECFARGGALGKDGADDGVVAEINHRFAPLDRGVQVVTRIDFGGH